MDFDVSNQLISEFGLHLETDYFFHCAIEQVYFFYSKSEQGNFFPKYPSPPPPPPEYKMDRALIRRHCAKNRSFHTKETPGLHEISP